MLAVQMSGEQHCAVSVQGKLGAVQQRLLTQSRLVSQQVVSVWHFWPLVAQALLELELPLELSPIELLELLLDELPAARVQTSGPPPCASHSSPAQQSLEMVHVAPSMRQQMPLEQVVVASWLISPQQSEPVVQVAPMGAAHLSTGMVPCGAK